MPADTPMVLVPRGLLERVLSYVPSRGPLAFDVMEALSASPVGEGEPHVAQFDDSGMCQCPHHSTTSTAEQVGGERAAYEQYAKDCGFEFPPEGLSLKEWGWQLWRNARQIAPSPGEGEAPVAWVDGEPVALPAISLDGPHRPCEHRVWLARQLLDSRTTDEEAYSTVAHSPAITDFTRPTPATPAGWIVSNANGDRWRTWEGGFSAWTDDREKATRYARREDAEAVHAEDEDAWRIEPYGPATPAGEEMREKVVWIVHGTSGEWSDRTEWCIEAHTDETRAKDRVAELTALARELAAAYPEVSEEAWESENYEEHPSYIANREWQRRCDAAGVGSDPEETRFFVSKVPLAALQPQAEGE